MEKKVYVCRKLFLYNWLVEHGFKNTEMRPDKYDCNKLIWIFPDSTEIRACVEEYYQNWKRICASMK